MELLDTPNPNAKKVEIDSKITNEISDVIHQDLNKIKGIASIFIGPGFITILKSENVEWDSITQDINNIFDKL